MSKKFYITTAIVYANAKPHIGFTYEVVAADVIARYKRIKGYDVCFSTGMDEHSINVKKKALSLGITPQEYCNKMADVYIDLWKKLNIKYDVFIRTSDKVHFKSVEKMIKNIFSKSDIYKSVYKGWYCVSCEAFLSDKDLIDKKCPVHKKEPEWLEEDNYFFALSKYKNTLTEYIQVHPEFIEPMGRRNEVLSMLDSELGDVSITRASFDWGVPFPFDKNHVIYVWFDALINYLSAINYSDEESRFNKYWPADLHIIGKDIIKFHCIIWPAMLLSAGLPLPKKVFAHGFLNFKGEKISKTRGNIVDPLVFVNEYGVDTLRYFLMREVPFGIDGNFSEEALFNRRNADLANDLGNLVNRVFSMVNKYCEGKIPKAYSLANSGNELREKSKDVIGNVDLCFSNLKFSDALTKIWELVKLANQYVDYNAPWKLFKDKKYDILNTVLKELCESIYLIAILIYPFMPDTGKTIIYQLNQDNLEISLKEYKWGRLNAEKCIRNISPLFPKMLKNLTK